LSKNHKKSSFCPVKIPISSEEELFQTVEKLKDKLIRDTFLKWCNSIGGVDFKGHTRRVLSRVFTNDFATRINFSGKGGKVKFSGLPIATQIIASVSSSQDCTASQVEEVAKGWFKYSKDRDGGRKRRAMD
ncbi:unnamed protein product, partial [Allacma fusca]